MTAHLNLIGDNANLTRFTKKVLACLLRVSGVEIAQANGSYEVRVRLSNLDQFK